MSTAVVTNQITLTTDDLASVLGIERQTLLNRRSRDPKSLPPALNIPGQRDPVWLTEDVLRWLRERSPYYQPEEPARQRGRPRGS